MEALPDLIPRYWKRVREGRFDTCWNWRGARDRHGYGHITLKRNGRSRVFTVHRIAYALRFGDPGSLVIRHDCDNPACCNPVHLRAGTQTDNMRDAAKRGRLRLRRKITQEQVARIRGCLAAGDVARVVAERFDVSISTVRHIMRNKSYRRKDSA